MKIDIAISFNDLNPASGLGFTLRQGKKPSYFQQLVTLVKSIKLNWDKAKLDYEIYAHYSRTLSDEKKSYLEELGCNLVFNDEELLGPCINRMNVFTHKTDGDYTLILDTDIIVLETPTFSFEHDVTARSTLHIRWSERKWSPIYEIFDFKHQQQSMNCPWNGEHIINNLNNGVLLFKNSQKQKFYDLVFSEKGLNALPVFRRYNKHMGFQFYFSFLITKFFDFGLFDETINVYTKDFAETPNAKLVHYLGRIRTMGGFSKEIPQMFDDINKLYDKKFGCN